MKKVLLVEEPKDVAVSRAHMLAELGYEVMVSTDIWNALEITRRERFDSIFYVLSLEAGGQNIPAYLRRANPEAKIVVYSSEAFLEEYRGEIQEAGAVPLAMVKSAREIAAEL